MTQSQSLKTIFPGEVFAEILDFDAGIRALIPQYEEMLDGITHCIPANANRVLELGCGTGELSLKVMNRCPQAQLVAVDYSPRMLSYAQAKLQQRGYGSRVTWVNVDFGDWANGGVMEIGNHFDVCVSSLAIHHLEDAMKLQLFQRIGKSLNPQGSFWNGDPVLPESSVLADIYQAIRAEWVAKQDPPHAEILAKRGNSKPQGYSSHDRLATLAAHLEMLTQAGFQTVAVPWKYYGLALFGGFLP